MAFATIFGGVTSHAPLIHATAVEDASRRMILPHARRGALSTDSGVVDEVAHDSALASAAQ